MTVSGVNQLEVTGVCKAFTQQRVLVGLDLVVERGSITAILGSSGSGKTTLLRLIAGFDHVDSGTIRVGGKVVDDGERRLPPERRGLGYVPQEGALFPHLSVAENVSFGLRRDQRRGSAVGDLIELVGLRGFERRYPDQLSGGQQQRVALARALAVQPSLILLDEPFSALDPELRTSIRNDVQNILHNANATALLVTHDQDEALSFCDSVAVLRDGRIIQHAAPHDLYTDPVDEDLAGFVGELNLIDGIISGSGADTVLGHLELRRVPAGADGRLLPVMLRPEQIDVGTDLCGAGTPAVVVASSFHGQHTRLTLECAASVWRSSPRTAPTGTSPVQTVTALSSRGSPIEVGAHVVLSVRGTGIAWERERSDDGS